MPLMTDQSANLQKTITAARTGKSCKSGAQAFSADANIGTAGFLDLLDAVMTRGLPLQDSIEAEPRYAQLEHAIAGLPQACHHRPAPSR